MARVVGILLVVSFLVPLGAAQSTPDQIHVTVAGTPADARMQPPEVTQLVVQWSVATPYGPHLRPQVKYRIENGTERMAPASLVGAPRDTNPPTNTAEFDLTPVYAARIPVPRGKEMSYQVGEPSLSFSAARSVRMVPNPVNNTTVVALSYIGYAGYSRTTGLREASAEAPQEAAIRLALNQSPDLALFVGNLAMSSSGKPWSGFFRTTEPLHATVPVAPVPGEGDADEDAYQFRERYVLPMTTADSSGRETEHTHHAFTAGPAMFLGLDSNKLCVRDVAQGGTNVPPVYPCPDGRPNTAYLGWIHDALEDAREDLKARWIIAYVGQGPYAYADDGDFIPAVKLLVPLFESFGVDLVLTGTEPIYQRSFPMRGGLPLTQERSRVPAGLGPVYVVVGPSGTGAVEPLTEHLPAWVAASNSSRMVTRLEISRDAINVTAIVAKTGSVADSFVLYRPDGAVGPSDPPEPERKAPGLDVGVLLLVGFAVLVYRRRV